MVALQVIFWLSLACVAYAYAGYPLAVAAWARLRPKPVRRDSPLPGSVSVVVAAYNEEASIGRRVAELSGLVAASGVRGEVIVASDGSSDRTVAGASAAADEARAAGRDVRVLDLGHNAGKAAALSAGCAAATGEIVVFADARQTWAPDALLRLLENFADPGVGAASGELVVESAPGVMAGVGLYWRYEKWLRRNEGVAWSVVGATGAISAVRRELFRPIPPGTILDDVYWPLCVALAGKRVVHDGRAKAFDRLPERAGAEFRRKVRTLSGNFQLFRRLPQSLLPWRNPIWAQLVSHKALRLVVPWALIGMLACCVSLEGAVYRAALGAQLAGYAVALAGLWEPVGRRVKLASAGASFLVLNAAALASLWVFLAGRAGRSWNKTAYTFVPAGGGAQA